MKQRVGGGAVGQGWRGNSRPTKINQEEQSVAVRCVHRQPHSCAWAPREDDNISGRENGLFRLGKTNHKGEDNGQGLPQAGFPHFGPSQVVSVLSFSSIILSRDRWSRQTTLWPKVRGFFSSSGPVSALPSSVSTRGSRLRSRIV